MPAAGAERARAVMVELFPQGFEERELADGDVEVAVYAPAAQEERFWEAFGPGRTEAVEPGWAEGWKRFHRSLRVGPLWIGPPWLEPDRGAIAVVVDPGRAFGTGAHPTTALCLELLVDAPRGRLVDVGCGSGVLAIAAAKLGFEPVLACDVDEVAVAVTRENARRNRVELEAVRVDALAGALPESDLVVANIAVRPVEIVAERLRCERLITSGYLVSDRPACAGWRHVERRERGSWAADRWERTVE